MCAPLRKGKVDRILTAASILSRPAGRSAQYTATPYVLRRVKRLVWFALVACVALVGSLEGNQELPQQLSVRLALAVILVASWAVVMHVTVYLRAEDARRATESEAARLEGARMTASAICCIAYRSAGRSVLRPFSLARSTAFSTAWRTCSPP